MSANLRKKGPFSPYIFAFLEKGGLFSSSLHKSQRFVEKGSILSTQQLFQACESQHSKEKWYKLRSQKSAFSKKGVLFSMKKSVERGRFVFWRTIIRPPFTFEGRDRDPSTYTSRLAGTSTKKSQCRLYVQTGRFRGRRSW